MSDVEQKHSSEKTWPNGVLAKIAQSDDLHIAPFRDDRTTYGTPTWIWSVVVDRELFVRPYNGTDSTWFASALRHKAGRIVAAGSTYEVSFELAEASSYERVDAAYRSKYGASPYLAAMIGERARSTTVRVRPREA